MPPVSEAEQRPLEDSKEECAWINKELLEGVLGDGSTVLSVDAHRAVAKGENFLSLLFRTRVQYTTRDSEEPQELHLMVKGVPDGEFIQVFVEEVGVFRREMQIYEETLPRLYSFADARLGKKNAFPRLSAEYFKTKRPDTLVLGDLKHLDFVMADRRNRLDFVHAKLVIENLARLHALSSAYDEANPGCFAQFDDRMFSEVNRERLEQFIPPQIKSLAEEIKKWEGFEGIAAKLAALEHKHVDRLIDVCKRAEGGRLMLIHGDCWVNNILFKYSENGEPEDIRFVDFQLTRQASLGFDLNYFIFSSLRTDVRVQHFDELLAIYCQTFQHWADKLHYTGPPLTLDEIIRETDRTMFFGFTSVLTTMAIVLADPDDAIDLADITSEDVEKGDLQLFDKIYASEAFREAFSSLLPFFDERGLLD